MGEEYKAGLKNILTAGIVIALSSVLSAVLFSMGIYLENILMIFMFGILIIIIKTKKHIYGIVSSLLMVAIFNYLFTDPRYTFHVNDKNYYITFVIFLVISYIVTTLTIQLQKQMDVSLKTQRITDTLYKISSGYLYVSGLSQVAEYGIHSLKNIQCREYYLFVPEEGTGVMRRYSTEEDGNPKRYSHAVDWCYQQSQACGSGTDNFNEIPFHFLPVMSKGITHGVLAVDCRRKPLSEEDQKMVTAVLSIIAIAMDREYASQSEQESKLAAEREKLRNNLLRSISHDLRTPLAGITGSTSFLLESYSQIDKEGRETLLRDMLNDSIWLGNLVDNLLNMTRIQDGRLAIKYVDEVVDDISAEVNTRIQSRLGSRTFRTKVPEDCMTVPMDGQLIIQVIVNLIDNAIKHTNSDGTITLKIERMVLVNEKQKTYAKFSVTDNGTGIDEMVRKHMFDSFITTDAASSESGRGIGLGLSIAKAIIEAHHGKIEALNNREKGATVYFALPLDRKDHHE